MNINIEQFNFYKVQKNEDATPYVECNEKSGIIAVADGLGGSGSSVHEIKRKSFESTSARLKKAFLPEYFKENSLRDIEFDQWLDTLIAPMIDEEPDTSALWGSRIAIARFAYFLKRCPDINLADYGVRKDIIDFIYKGVTETAKEFELKPGLLQGQLVLPTTLCALKYRLTDEGVSVDTLWTGDSRAYYITNCGIKQLTKDDEDASGAISNLIGIKNGQQLNTDLRHKAYEFPPKCVAFVCSDGIFDPYEPVDNIGVEAVFLDCLNKSDSYSELKENWYKHFEPMTHDDCSLAFLAFGYSSFADLKKDFNRRIEIIDTLNEYFEYKKFIPIIYGEDEQPEVRIDERAKQRKKEIADKIASEYICNPDSTDAIIKAIKNRIGGLYKDLRQQKENAVKTKIAVVMKNYFKKNRTDLDKVFVKPQGNGGVDKQIGRILVADNNYKVNLAKVTAAKNELDKVEKFLSGTEKSGEKLKRKLNQRAEEISGSKDLTSPPEKVYNFYVKNYGSNHEKTRCVKKNFETIQAEPISAKEAIAAINNAIKNWDEKIPRNVSGYYPADEEDIKEISRLANVYNKQKKQIEPKRGELKSAESSRDKTLSTLCLKIATLCKFYQNPLIQNPKIYLTESACNECNLPIKKEELEVTVDMLAEEIEKQFETKNNQLFYDVMSAFKQNDSPCIIDGIFNPGVLKLYRSFKKVNTNNVKKLSEKINKMLDDSAAYRE